VSGQRLCLKPKPERPGRLETFLKRRKQFLKTKENAMLVLSRKKNQTIVIDGKIEIEVVKVKGNTVRLGITAPNDIKVLRGELAPFEIEMKLSDIVTTESATFEAGQRDRLPNPFAVAHAS